MMSLKITETSDGLAIKIKVVPGGSRTRIAGLLDDALKINVAAAPEKGKANKELIGFLAKWLDLPKQCLTIVRGEHNVRKEILIRQIDRKTLLSKIQSELL